MSVTKKELYLIAKLHKEHLCMVLINLLTMILGSIIYYIIPSAIIMWGFIVLFGVFGIYYEIIGYKLQNSLGLPKIILSYHQYIDKCATETLKCYGFKVGLLGISSKQLNEMRGWENENN